MAKKKKKLYRPKSCCLGQLAILQFQSRVNGNYTTHEVFIFHPLESSFLDHLSKFFLIWEPTYTLNQVLVRLSITSNQLSHSWNHRKRINIIAEKKGSKFERGQEKELYDIRLALVFSLPSANKQRRKAYSVFIKP